MRIAHLLHQFIPETQGGVESYVRDLAKAQSRLGHDVVIITGSLKGRPQVEAEPFEVEGLKGWRCYRDDLYFDAWDRMYAPRVTDLVLSKIEDCDPDIVHLHHWIRLGQDIGSRVAESGRTLVATLHDFATSCPRAFRMRPDESPCFRKLSVESCLDCVPRWPWMDDAETTSEIEIFARSARVELSRVRRIICASEAVRDVIGDGLGIDSQRFRVAPLGYRPRFGRPARKVESTEPFRFGYWGSITHRKGVHLLIAALESVLVHRPESTRPIELEIYGKFDLPEREESLRQAASGLPIHFHGAFDYADLPDAGLSAAVFPSLCIETYGIVLDEAFELGLPVVVPNMGALASRAGGAGRTFEANDAGSLARALGAVADDPALRGQLVAALPGLGPDDDEHAALIAAIYQEALDDRSSPAGLPALISAEERARHLHSRSQSQFRRLLERGELG